MCSYYGDMVSNKLLSALNTFPFPIKKVQKRTTTAFFQRIIPEIFLAPVI